MRTRIAVGALALSAVGLLSIAKFEGFSEVVYQPLPGDVPTAGFGHADPRLKVGDRITSQQALTWLGEDVREAEDAVRRCVKVALTQGEFDAFVSFTYNVGATQFCNSTLVNRVNHRDYSGACGELTRWVYFKGQPIRGLERRRLEELRMCRGD